MDSIATVADFSLTIGGVAQLVSSLQATTRGVLPPQQQPPLTKHVSSSFLQAISFLR